MPYMDPLGLLNVVTLRILGPSNGRGGPGPQNSHFGWVRILGVNPY